MPMDCMFTKIHSGSQPDSANRLRRLMAQPAGRYTFSSNHDIERSYNRYGDGKHNDEIAKVMAGLYLTLRGTPILYYGEEIGIQKHTIRKRRRT